MIEILALDEQIFHWINSGWSNHIFDYVAPYWRHKLVWMPMYFFLFAFIIMNFRKQAIFIFLLVGLTGLLSDVASSHLIKKNVKRTRPCNNPEVRPEMTLRVRCGSGYSFTSSHATNHFAIATILVLVFGSTYSWVRYPLYGWAASISIGQVYVGVHYPIDIICGGILGYFCAKIAFLIFEKIEFQFLKSRGLG